MARVSSILQRNHVTLSGRGERVLIFGHGFGTSQEAWSRVTPFFGDSHRVACFDHVGSGQSDRAAFDPEKYGSLWRYAADLVEICDALGASEVDYVGHSVGGLIGMLASLLAPSRFRRLVLLGSSPRYLNDPPDYVGGFERQQLDGLVDLMDRNALVWATQFAMVALGESNGAEIHAHFAQVLQNHDPFVRHSFAEATLYCDHRAELARVRHPCLFVHCRDDVIASPDVGTYMQRRVAGSSLCMLPASGHCPHLTHPQQTAQAIADFVDEAQSS
jgi:sigma-B regulation protein RsbQ